MPCNIECAQKRVVFLRLPSSPFLASSGMISKPSVRVNEHLGVAVGSLVEFLICIWRIIDTDLMADDEAGSGLASDDEVAEVAIIGFDVALAGC